MCMCALSGGAVKPVGEDRKLAREVQEKFAGETAASTTASTNTSPNGGALPAPIVLGAHTSSSASGGGGSVADNTGMAPELLPPPSFRPILRGESWESMGGVSSGRDEGDDMEYRPDPLRNLSVTRVRSDSVTLSSDVNGGSSVGGINTRTYACLVATLNSSFPDYDFSSLPRDAFRRMPDIAEAVSNVNNQLTELAQLEAREPKLAQELNFAAYSVQTLAAPHTPVTPPTPQPASAGLSRADSTGHISAAGSTARHAGGRSRAGSVSGADAASGGTGAGGADASAVPMPPTWRPTLHRKGSAPNNSVSGADEGHASAAVHGSTPAPAAAAHTSSVASAGSHASMPRERAGSVSARQPSTAQSSSSASTLSTSVAGQVPDTPAGYILQRLSKVPGGYGMSFMEALWLILNDVITLSACEVYTYTPIWDTDPLIVGALWSFNYFFVNRQRKKLVFFSCTARRFVLAMRYPCCHVPVIGCSVETCLLLGARSYVLVTCSSRVARSHVLVTWCPLPRARHTLPCCHLPVTQCLAATLLPHLQHHFSAGCRRTRAPHCTLAAARCDEYGITGCAVCITNQHGVWHRARGDAPLLCGCRNRASDGPQAPRHT